jgi:hypothetical protein
MKSLTYEYNVRYGRMFWRDAQVKMQAACGCQLHQGMAEALK